MFRKLLLSILLLALGTVYAQEISVMSYNIRYDNPKDAENNWHQRKAELISLIQSYAPGVLGIQEGLVHQVQTLKNGLGYDYVGVGRDDAKEKGEFSAIFYDPKKYELKSSGTFWLSPTPDSISVGWDAAMERICTYAQLKEKNNGIVFWVFNAHFDHRGAEARKQSAQVILDKVTALNTEAQPVIVMGDLNAKPHSPAIRLLSQHLSDSRLAVDNIASGPTSTFNGFKEKVRPATRIDYIFTSKNIEVLQQSHIDERRGNGLQVSDHLPVLVRFQFTK
ncbi:endonuclease/exonuclease/phosphatase family protein [Sediminicola luteus]|uniref:Endonuclease/exonuclease/phosphatase domain-containing protein n=1 Tax=Sediminicola luteus TaxID=319238 RepID=A0A2A4GCD6_9FLAO|nr:endonuclease/exonuclease/phosphatase family protein [Sediminicola luteus]PCE66619.1 hypothetical protein B7P33_04815 [Sediminicola luteus]